MSGSFGFPSVLLFELISWSTPFYFLILNLGLNCLDRLFRARGTAQTVLEFGRATVVHFCEMVFEAPASSHLRLYIQITTYFAYLVYNHRLYSTFHIWEDLYYFLSIFLLPSL